MKLAIVFMLTVMVLSAVVGFRISSKFSNPMMSSRRIRTCMATTDDVVLHEKIINEIRASLATQLSAFPVDPRTYQIFSNFVEDYAKSNMEAGVGPEVFQPMIEVLLKSIRTALTNPYPFQPYHKSVREPIDYYQWGNDFFRPLVIKEQSKLFGKENAKKMEALLKEGHNVVLLSNHQTEVDPQVISILLEQEGLHELAEKMIFLAGHKVTNDPIAIPFSMGRNLLCIHSKKHIRNPPEDFERKQAQNMEATKAMGQLASQGGNIFWVAPSGGRDRPDETGEFVVANFDAKSLDMFKLMAIQSRKPMHFFPMAMYTHKLIPPPKSVSSDLGEERSAKRGAISIEFLDETDGLGGLKDKAFTAELQARVNEAYRKLCEWHASF